MDFFTFLTFFTCFGFFLLEQATVDVAQGQYTQEERNEKKRNENKQKLRGFYLLYSFT